MARARDLDAFWNWLPAFRAAAEAEHLSAAAQELGVSPSSLSRSIKLLETALDTQLFDRSGGAFRLTPAGRSFLESLRDGMRLIHEGYRVVTRKEPVGCFVISCEGAFAPRLLRILAELGERYPRLTPDLRAAPRHRVNDLLLLGELDVAVVTRPTPQEGIHTASITTLTHGVYCGPAHPLHDVEQVSVERIVEFPFCAPRGETLAADGWPPHVERDVTLHASELPLLIEACAAGRHLAVLPDLALRASECDVPLRRLPVELIPETELFALRRSDVQPEMTAQLIVEAICQDF